MKFFAGGFTILVLIFQGEALNAGTVVGIVKAQGPSASSNASESTGAYQSRRYKFAEKIDFEHLTDFVVYIDQTLDNSLPSTSSAEVVTKGDRVRQHDANFVPHVLPIAVGTTVKWPNDDDIYHNVFSTSDAREFDLQLYKKERTPEIVFDKTGRVDVFCNIHSNMHCIVLVLPNAKFAKVDANNRFLIKDVPAGTYKISAWHERLPKKTQTIQVPAEGEVTVDFTLGLGELPKF